MRKTSTAFTMVTCFLIQAFIFINASFACGDFVNNKAEADCLSPALQIGREEISKIYFVLHQNGDIQSSGLKQPKENGQYNALLNRLIAQVGSADDLLKAIKVRYYNKFAKAISILEEKEKQYKIHNSDWIIEHQKEVMLMSYCMGKILGFTDQELAKLAIGARFHDIGKCEVDPKLINYGHPFLEEYILTEGERGSIRNQINEHAARSYNILKAAGIKDELVLSAAYYHHANVDGSGYPDPVSRQEIPREAQITRVADSFSAMLGIRPYQRSFQQSFAKAVTEIEQNSYYLYGPRTVKTFLYMLSDNVIQDRYKELYKIPLVEGGIFRELFKAAQKNRSVYPFAKVACGISVSWNEKPYRIATNSIGVHRHAEINLVLGVLDEHLRKRGMRRRYIDELRRLEFLAYTSKLNQSPEALQLLSSITLKNGNPFEGAVIYNSLRPCSSCLELLAFLGIRQIYYASEHQSPEFIASSEETVRGLRRKGIKIAQAHFVNEGVLEPNGLFFAFCRQPGYEKITETINNWFAQTINHDDMHRFPIDVMRKKEQQFVDMMNKLLVDINAESDLELVNERLIQTKKMITNREVDVFTKYSVSKSQGILMQAI